MKGISHFITGVALATFFPEVVRLAQHGSLLPVFGGLGGILPDTLDFKFARYWEQFQLEIDPGLDPDAEAIADALVTSMRAAYETGQDQNVIAHTVRVGPDLWREYAIRFYPEAGEVAVQAGPLVNTGQVPYAGTEPENAAEARRAVGLPMVHTYSDEYRVNIFTGPTFRFAREGDKLVVHFLDWHHRWTHSLLLAAGVGLVAGLLLTLLTGPTNGLWAGALVALGFAGHILEDQMGHMGSNLFWPLTRKRIPGPGLIHAGDAIPNFLTVWTALTLILFNLDRFSGAPRFAPLPYLLVAVGMPWLILGGVYIGRKLHAQVERSQAFLRQAEKIAEADGREMA